MSNGHENYNTFTSQIPTLYELFNQAKIEAHTYTPYHFVIARYNSTLVPAVSGLMTSNGNPTNREHDMRMVVMPTAIHTELASSVWPPIGHGDKTYTESA